MGGAEREAREAFRVFDPWSRELTFHMGAPYVRGIAKNKETAGF